MSSSFSTSKLEQSLRKTRLKNEKNRQALLNKTIKWLEQYARQYHLNCVYIFGSVTRPHHFNQRSDIDLAVETINPDYFFLVISLLSEYLEREVDLIHLKHCHFAERIRQTGIQWTPIS
ncbi:MAG: nucleotidyltransferase family protein [Microcystaceae cyanobacterium]